jgi:hypothetical protein
MKHTNQEGLNKNQTAATDQHRKTNKAQQGDGNESMDQQNKQGTKEHAGKQGSDSSNWQKDKQGNKK